jgi:hypothetical protein
LQVYFLYLNTDLAFRDRNLRNMLSIYHQTFSLYLSPEEGYMPDQVRPFTLFLMRMRGLLNKAVRYFHNYNISLS